MKVAFCGKMASGKTTLAERVLPTYQDSRKFSFAQAVKDFARFLYDIPEDFKDRVKFQKVGDGARKFINPNVWIDAVLHQTENLSDWTLCVIDDVRYENEVKHLKEAGWKVVLLEINEDLQIERLKKTYPNDWEVHAQARSHPSEAEIDSIDKSLFDLILKAEDGDANYNQIMQHQW